jgi:hypothetical protein
LLAGDRDDEPIFDQVIFAAWMNGVPPPMGKEEDEDEDAVDG